MTPSLKDHSTWLPKRLSIDSPPDSTDASVAVVADTEVTVAERMTGSKDQQKLPCSYWISCYEQSEVADAAAGTQEKASSSWKRQEEVEAEEEEHDSSKCSKKRVAVDIGVVVVLCSLESWASDTLEGSWILSSPEVWEQCRQGRRRDTSSTVVEVE
jgi:hypothetical protein